LQWQYYLFIRLSLDAYVQGKKEYLKREKKGARGFYMLTREDMLPC